MKKNKKSKNKKPANFQPVTRQRKLVTLETKLQAIYHSVDLSTTCCRQCTCCRVACPQMKFGEANHIIDKIWNEWSKADKKALLVTSVKYFFSDSLVKPCPLLKDGECRIYESRPLNCRLFGLWPEDMWKKRVEGFVQATGLPADKLPLNTQCSFVRRATVKEPLKEEEIARLFDALDILDSKIGVDKAKVKSSWNYRTIHDWVLLKFWGENVLVQWTNLLLASEPIERQAIMEAFLEQVEKTDFGL